MGVRKSVVAPVSPISGPTVPSLPPLRSRECLTIPQAAVYLSVSNWWIEQAVRNGLLPFRELDNGSNSSPRLLSAEDLDNLVASQPKQRVLRIEKGKAITERAA